MATYTQAYCVQSLYLSYPGVSFLVTLSLPSSNAPLLEEWVSVGRFLMRSGEAVFPYILFVQLYLSYSPLVIFSCMLQGNIHLLSLKVGTIFNVSPKQH